MFPYEILWNVLLETYFKYISRLLIKSMNHSDLPEQRKEACLFFFFCSCSTEFILFTSELDYRYIEKWLEVWFNLKHKLFIGLFSKEFKLAVQDLIFFQQVF